MLHNPFRIFCSLVLIAVIVLSPSSSFAGFEPHEVRTFERHKEMALKGDPAGQHALATHYVFGGGVLKDEVEAAKWYRKAAEQGYARSQDSLARCYLNGEGLAKDEAEALKWFRKAADQGYTLAQIQVGVFYAKGIIVTKDQIEAYAYFNLAGISDEIGREALTNLEKGMTQEARLKGQQRTKELLKEIEARKISKRVAK